MRLVLLRGLPGSGKSTLAELIANDLDCMNFEADMFFESIGFNPELLPQAHSWCFGQAVNAFSIGMQNVVVANTFTRRWEMARYQELAERVGAELIVIKCELEEPNVHDVPDHTVERMRARWEDFPGEINPIQFHVGEVF